MKPRYHLEFTEEMKGYVGFGADDFAAGSEAGQAAGWSIMFHLTISTDDVYAFISDRDHVGSAHGWVGCDALGGRRPVDRGVFNLFVDAGEYDGRPRKHMLYRLWFEDDLGRPLTLTGFKDIREGSPTDVWPDTSTLYTRLLQGHVEPEGDDAAPIVASGIIHILPLDFVRQCTTFRVSGPGLAGRLQAFAAFGKLFMGQLWAVFRPHMPSFGKEG